MYVCVCVRVCVCVGVGMDVVSVEQFHTSLIFVAKVLDVIT